MTVEIFDLLMGRIRFIMLEYEKKLHLDKNWEKMQSMQSGKTLFSLLMNVITYVGVYLLLKKVLTYLPDLQPWNNCKVIKSFWGIDIKLTDCFYFALGIITYIYGTIRFIKINRENHSVRDQEHKPTRLLIDGCYAKVRHPMYGTFVLRNAATFLALRSLIGIIITAVFIIIQYLNAKWEEPRELIPMFQEDYRKYIQTVKRILFSVWEFVALLLMILVSLIGILI